jgi:hypothetical protein
VKRLDMAVVVEEEGTAKLDTKGQKERWAT